MISIWSWMRLKQGWHGEVFLLPPFVREQPTFGDVVFIIYFQVAKVDFWVSRSYDMCALRKRHLGRALYGSSIRFYFSQSSPINPALRLLVNSYPSPFEPSRRISSRLSPVARVPGIAARETCTGERTSDIVARTKPTLVVIPFTLGAVDQCSGS